MIVTVHTVLPNPGGVTFGSTVAKGVGIDPETGDTIHFGGDWRPMAALAEAVWELGEVDAEVEDWAIVRRIPAVKEN